MGSLTLARLQPDSPLPLVRRFLHPLAARNSFYYPLVLAPLYLTIGPWFVGNVLSDSVGKKRFFVGKIKHLFSPTLERPICRLEMRKALNSRHKSPFPVTKCLLFVRDRVLLGHPGAGQLRAHGHHLDVRRVPPGHRPPPPHPHHRRDYQHQDRVRGSD